MPEFISDFQLNRSDDWFKRREEREQAAAEEHEKEAKKRREKREAEIEEEKRLRALIHVEEYFDPDTGKVQEKILVFPKELKPNFSDLFTFMSYDKVMYLRRELCYELLNERKRTEKQQYVMLHTGVEKQNRINGLESKVSPLQSILQDRLIEACKQGNAKAVRALLKRGAKPDIANAKGEQPLGAAVWGMCPDVVNALLKREDSGEFFAPMTWRECEEHNLRHYKAVFIVPKFAPEDDDYDAWYRLFLDMRRNPFVRASHLRKADKQWHNNATSSWVNLLMYLSNYVWVRQELSINSPLFTDRTTQERENSRKEEIEKEKNREKEMEKEIKRKKECSKIHAATEREFVNYRAQIKKSIELAKQPRVERIEQQKQKNHQQQLEHPLRVHRDSLELKHAQKGSFAQSTLQDQLIEACKQGDAKAVGILLTRGAKPDIANDKGEQPLGAAVWGMCPDVVNALLRQADGGGFFDAPIAPMTWRECEEHNLNHYKEVFIVPKFYPKTYEEWYQLLLKIESNPFIRAFHLKKVAEQWDGHETGDITIWEGLESLQIKLGSLFISRGPVGVFTLHASRKTETEFVSYRAQIKREIESATQPKVELTSYEQKLAAAEEEKQKTFKKELEITSNAIAIEEKKSQRAEQALLQNQQETDLGTDQATDFKTDQRRNEITKLSVLGYPEEKKDTAIFCEDITNKLTVNKETKYIASDNTDEQKALNSVGKLMTEKEIHDRLYQKSLTSVKEKKDILNQLQNGLDELSKIELDIEDKHPKLNKFPTKETLQNLQSHQKELFKINQNLQKMALKQQRAQTVYFSSDPQALSGPQKEKIKLFQQILELNLSDYFITNIAIAKELTDPILSKATRISAGSLGFIAGKIPIPPLIGSLIGIALPFVGPLIGVAVSEGIKYAIASHEIKEAQKWCFGITTVMQAAAFAKCVADQLMFRYRLVVSQLDPLAVEVFAECLVKRAFLYLRSLNSIPPDWVSIANYAVMGAGILKAAEDSLVKATDDNDVLLIHNKGKKRYITVNQVCQSSAMLTWKSEFGATKYYEVHGQIQTENKMEIVLPHCFVSQFEMDHCQLRRGKIWNKPLPIDLSLPSDLRLENEQLKAEISQLRKEKEINESKATVLSQKSDSPTKGAGLFDNASIPDSLNKSLLLQNKLSQGNSI